MTFLHHYAGLLLIVAVLVAFTASNWHEISDYWTDFFQEVARSDAFREMGQ